LLISIGLPQILNGQDLNLKIGVRVPIKSEILNEQRSVIIHLPDNYDNSGKSYPVIYRLDGSMDIMLETVATINRLSVTEEIIPEMIVVAIENTNRDRDMWPVKNRYYSNEPGAEKFLKFIEHEILPYIEKDYRTTEHRIICGQSLSSVFTFYVLLTKPNLFDSYIIISGAFPDSEKYFNELSQKAFLQIDQFYDKEIFISNGLKDPLDPDSRNHKQILDFSNTLRCKAGNISRSKYVAYENEGHVPFISLYDGLRFIFDSAEEEFELPTGAFPIVYRGHIYIPGNADGIKGNFVFDTGASNLYYDTTYYADNEFRYEDLLTAKLPGAGTKPQDVIVIKDTVDFTFGNYLYRTPRVPVLKLKPILGDFSDGIIGLEYFHQSIMEINYEREYIRIYSDIGSINLSDYCKIDLLKEGNRLYIPLKVNINDTLEISGNFQLDFGAGGTIGLTSSATNKFNLTETIDIKTPYYSKYAGVGGESSRFDFMAASVEIGDFAFNNVCMNFSTDKSGAMASDKHLGLLGNRIYDRFHVYIDFINHDLYLKPNSKYEDLFKFSRLGFSYVDRNQSMNSWIVTGMYIGCNAEKQGLEIDDKIIAVNEIGVDQISYESQKGFFERLSEIVLTVKRKNELLDIKFKLEAIQ
ncbi:MAG: hypothetical protein HOK80_03445, partial [Candidatus Cloacimonetes bacterium]|nr:hypothetical protein [Candidatus Cloacimonadota bacterium]